MNQSEYNRRPSLTLEEWTASQSYSEVVVPEIGAFFFTGGRPTTHYPESGLANIHHQYANTPQRYLQGMDTEEGRLKVRHELQAHYMKLACDKNASGNTYDWDYHGPWELQHYD